MTETLFFTRFTFLLLMVILALGLSLTDFKTELACTTNSKYWSQKSGRCMDLQEMLTGISQRKVPEWKSQAGQDRFVFEALGHKKGGYFVEVGAADGVYILQNV